MKKITDMVSKEVVSVAEGEILGIVTNGYTDEKLARIRGFKVSGEESEEARALPIRRLLGEGDALTVTSSSVLKEFSARECPLGVKVFDSAGSFLGVLRDLFFDETDGRITALSVGESELSPSSVIRFGRSAILLRSSLHEGKVFRRKGQETPPRARRTGERRAPAPLPHETRLTTQASALPVRTLHEDAPKHDYTFLLGRSVLRTIGAEGSPIAQAGEKVTPEILQRARESGKLVELTVNSRR